MDFATVGLSPTLLRFSRGQSVVHLIQKVIGKTNTRDTALERFCLMALVQLDRASLEESGWEIVWKDASKRSPSNIREGLVIGGYRLANNELVLHPPQYSEEYCVELKKEEGAGCSVEWTTWISKVIFAP